MYPKSTHFLLELIQNADDNQYDLDPDDLPSLSLTYSGAFVRIACNEKGFTKKDVEAICRIGSSTKAGLQDSTGEKGIGFKSVFSVADVVWIVSGAYSFRFEKKEELGMIAPIWSDYPKDFPSNFPSDFPSDFSHAQTGTVMLLRLSKDESRRSLDDEIKAFNPRILIFLRRLREIQFTTGKKVRKFRRTDQIAGSCRKTVLHNDGLDHHYIVIQSTAKSMPLEPRRPDSSTSEISLAFPLTETGQAIREPQQVFSYLPIREYGFEVR